ncbi:MAG: TonB family protein [Patescibacteria group bacterium]|mgnify:CR=1 FL=1
MLTNLLASKPKKQRTAGVMMFSLITHIVIIVAATYATLQAVTVVKEKREENISFVEAPKNEPPPQPKVVQQRITVATPPKGFQVLIAPINIPDFLPKIDPNIKVTDEKDFTGKGVQGGIGAGVGSAPINPDQPFSDDQVDRTVMQLPNSARPRYPDMLRSAGVEGEVLAQFVVDTTGRVEVNTFKVLRTSHEMFTNAVRNVLPNMMFSPAEVNGIKVKQLVQQPFTFTIRR